MDKGHITELVAVFLCPQCSRQEKQMGKCKPIEVSREEEWPERVSAKGEGTKEGVPRASQRRGKNTEVKYKDQ